MNRFLIPLILVVITAAAVVPAVTVIFGEQSGLTHPVALALLNLIAWTITLALVLNRQGLFRGIQETATNLGIDTRFRTLESVLDQILREINRKNSSLLISLVEQRITSREELSRTFEKIVSLSFKLLDAESAELSLFDRESGLYHSAFVLGKPFHASAQAMLSGAVDRDGREQVSTPDVLIQPIAFAGTMLGTLRVGLKTGCLPSVGDREIMRLLALQSSLAMINLQYSQELLRLKQASDESVRAKTGFLANLSHEIRGPLGIILNAAELVLDGLCGEVSTDQRETLSMVKSNGEHLLELINDVLDFAKVESGKIQVDRVNIITADLLSDLVQVVRGQAESKSHRIIYRPNPEALGFSCDRRHARQMLINLLTNAIKYTPDGGTIEVWAERAPGGKIKINVKDSGVGIEQSDRSKVFSAFERVDNAYSMKQVGTGLGMPLTKKLAEVNDAHVDFVSEPGKGSQFWLLFNAVEVHPHDVATSVEVKQAAVGAGERVMFFAPDDSERSMVERYLNHIGFSIIPVHSEHQALDAIRERKVQLCILDNSIIDDSEERLVNLIRQRAQNQSLPIVLLSSRGFVFDIEKYLRIGIDRCLVKPVELRDLGIICRQLLDGAGSERVSDGAAPRRPHGSGGIKGIFH